MLNPNYYRPTKEQLDRIAPKQHTKGVSVKIKLVTVETIFRFFRMNETKINPVLNLKDTLQLLPNKIYNESNIAYVYPDDLGNGVYEFKDVTEGAYTFAGVDGILYAKNIYVADRDLIL